MILQEDRLVKFNGLCYGKNSSKEIIIIDPLTGCKLLLIGKYFIPDDLSEKDRIRAKKSKIEIIEKELSSVQEDILWEKMKTETKLHIQEFK